MVVVCAKGLGSARRAMSIGSGVGTILTLRFREHVTAMNPDEESPVDEVVLTEAHFEQALNKAGPMGTSSGEFASLLLGKTCGSRKGCPPGAIRGTVGNQQVSRGRVVRQRSV